MYQGYVSVWNCNKGMHSRYFLSNAEHVSKLNIESGDTLLIDKIGEISVTSCKVEMGLLSTKTEVQIYGYLVTM